MGISFLYNCLLYTSDVEVSNITSASGVEKVRMPVWCERDQNDIVWYDAEKQSDGTYKACLLYTSIRCFDWSITIIE